MEQQPGPVNWAPFNPAPLPGMVRLWSWEAFAHGAEVVSYFRWRQVPFGQEQMHAGLKYPDDTDASGLADAAQVAREVQDMPDVAPAQAPVALVFDYASDWAWKTLPQGADFDYFRLVFEAYRALRRQGLSVDILPPSVSDLEGYALVLAPGLASMPAALMQAMREAEAVCLLGPRSNLITDSLRLHVPAGPQIDGLDVVARRVESLPPGSTRPVAGGGAVIRWDEHLEGAARVILQTEARKPVLMGDGALHYLGGWPDGALWDRVIAELAQMAGLELTSLPEGLRLRDTATHRFAFNYGPEPVTWKDQDIEAAGVAWWPHGP